MAKKYASGGAIGGLDSISQAADQLSGSLNQISTGLYGGGDESGTLYDLGGSSGSSSAPQSNTTPVGGLKNLGLKKGGVVTASRRGDGIAQRGKTRGKMC
jgi:hypothetical protein